MDGPEYLAAYNQYVSFLLLLFSWLTPFNGIMSLSFITLTHDLERQRYYHPSREPSQLPLSGNRLVNRERRRSAHRTSKVRPHSHRQRTGLRISYYTMNVVGSGIHPCMQHCQTVGAVLLNKLQVESSDEINAKRGQADPTYDSLPLPFVASGGLRPM